MKIAIISPILAPPSREDGIDYREKFRLRDCANVPAEFEFSYISEGPRFILNSYDDSYAAPDLLRKVIEAEKNGADAIVINCSADTALRACREAVSIPVIGPTESTFLYASQLVDTFAVLTFSNRINNRFVRIAHELGLSHKLECVKSVEIDFDDISNGEQAVVDSLFDVIKGIHDEDRCDGYILGCTDFEDVAPQLSEKLKQNSIEVVLLKPFEISVYQAYITASMGLKQGKNSYPKPQCILC